MRKHLEPLAELEAMGAESGPWLLQEQPVRARLLSLAHPAAAPGTKCVWLTQALPCLLISRPAHTDFCFRG